MYESGGGLTEDSSRKSILPTISEAMNTYGTRIEDCDDENSKASSDDSNNDFKFVCINGKHIPPQFEELANSGLLTEKQLDDCEKILINSMVESMNDKSDRRFFFVRMFSANALKATSEHASKVKIDWNL